MQTTAEVQVHHKRTQRLHALHCAHYTQTQYTYTHYTTLHYTTHTCLISCIIPLASACALQGGKKSHGIQKLEIFNYSLTKKVLKQAGVVHNTKPQ